MTELGQGGRGRERDRTAGQRFSIICWFFSGQILSRVVFPDYDVSKSSKSNNYIYAYINRYTNIKTNCELFK